MEKFKNNLKTDEYYLNKICDDLAFIIEHMRGVDQFQLSQNEILLDSMLFRLIQISENSKKLSYEFIETNNNIPWNELKGFRNRIVHDYGNVDIKIIYDTLSKDIQVLLHEIECSEIL